MSPVIVELQSLTKFFEGCKISGPGHRQETHFVGMAAIFDQGNRVGMATVSTGDVARDKDVTLASLDRDEDAGMIVTTGSTGDSRGADYTGRAVRIKVEPDNDNFA